jgi:hypothetical protein
LIVRRIVANIAVTQPSGEMAPTSIGHATECGPTDEPWGVRRFHLGDPRGTLLNALSHPG